jgi:hypothetical protein
MTHHIDLSAITLETGSHEDREGGCVMEWVAIFAGLDKTDEPVCTSPVLRAFAIAFNDGVDDATRQRLVPIIPRLVGTADDPEADERRAWMATDWLVRTFTPAWLRKAGMEAEADALVALSGPNLAREAQPIIESARAKARDAARDAAWAAAGAAAGDAAWAAAGAAARDAAWAAAWAAAGAAAGAAASKKSGYEAQYAAARKAANAVLKDFYAETITEMREDALRLFDRMIDTRTAVPA